MIKVGQAYIYNGNDLNFRGMKCITYDKNEKGFKVTFFDERLGKVDTTVNQKYLRPFL